MTKHRQLLYGQPIPQDFLDALQEFIGTMASPNLDLTMVPGSFNQIQIVAGTGSAQVALAIDGLWRYISATTTTTVTGSAATYDIFVTTNNNSFSTNPSPPPPELDATDYTFTLAPPLLQGNVPATAHYRKVGEAVFDGTRIVSLRQMIDIDSSQGFQTGDLKLSAVANPQAGWLLCNGQAVNRVTFAALYAALGGATSPWGQGDGSTTFNVPDLRSRAPIGAGQGAGLTNRPLGTYGGGTLDANNPKLGEEAHLLSALESGTNANGTMGTQSANHSHTGTTDNDAPDHSHGFSQAVASAAGISNVSPNGISGSFPVPYATVGGWGGLGGTGGASTRHTHTFTTANNTGTHTHTPVARPADNAHNSMQPFVATNVFIKT